MKGKQSIGVLGLCFAIGAVGLILVALSGKSAAQEKQQLPHRPLQVTKSPAPPPAGIGPFTPIILDTCPVAAPFTCTVAVVFGNDTKIRGVINTGVNVFDLQCETAAGVVVGFPVIFAPGDTIAAMSCPVGNVPPVATLELSCAVAPCNFLFVP